MIFENKEFLFYFFVHRNPYSLYSLVGTEFEVGTKIEKSVIVINAEINVAVNYFSA